jgi:hypothetical protein
MTTEAGGPAPAPRAVSPLPPEVRPYQGHRAGLVTRMVAAVIDSLVVAVVLMTGYVGYAAVVFLVDPRSFSFPTPGVFFSLTAALAVLVVYLAG